MVPASQEHITQFVDAVQRGDAAAVSHLLEDNAVRFRVDDPLFEFDAPAIVFARRNREIVEVLLDAGADVNIRSQWKAGGFGVLDDIDAEQAEWLITRGATLDVHSAAGLGKLAELERMLDADPKLVHARGGDGQFPLHFANRPDVIDLLLERGAEVDARDLDHRSTAAQWAVPRPANSRNADDFKSESAKCRHLVSRGATADIFMAIALGDLGLTRSILDAHPHAIRARIADGEYPLTPAAPGAHIYIYRLANNASPHQVALMFGSEEILELLNERSGPAELLLTACWQGDTHTARRIVAENPGIVEDLPPKDASLIADAAWDNRLESVALMLNLGFDINVRGVHDSTPLDRAAFHGFDDIVELALAFSASVDVKNEFSGTPLEACLFGLRNGWRNDGNYANTVHLLLEAGAKLTGDPRPTGMAQVDVIISEHLEGDND
jgi:ankyrin repeat protein